MTKQAFESVFLSREDEKRAHRGEARGAGVIESRASCAARLGGGERG